MPSKSEKQSRTAGMAIAYKRGELDAPAGPAVKNMSSMPISKLKHFLKIKKEGMSLNEKKTLVEDLKGVREVLSPIEPMYLQETGEEPQVVVSDIPRNGDVDLNTDVVRLDGIKQDAFPLDPLEKQSIINYKTSKPTAPKQTNPNAIRYDSLKDNTNTTTIIQKMQNGSEYNFVAFQRMVSSGTPGSDEDVTSPLGSGKLKVITTRTFIEPSDGGNILSDLLKKLDL